MGTRSEFTNLVIMTGYLVWAEEKNHTGQSKKVQGVICLPGKREYRSEYVPFAVYGTRIGRLADAQAAFPKDTPPPIELKDAERGALITIEGRLAGAGGRSGSFVLVDRIRYLDDES